MKALIAAVVIGSLITTGVIAESRTYGAGVRGCGQYVTALKNAETGDRSGAEQYLQWALGYLTAGSLVSNIDFLRSVKDRDSVELWLGNYCRAHPLETFLQATIELSGELRKPQ